jgi:FtsH-binding integral membrane protein
VSLLPAGERISTRRKWTAIGAATLLVTGSYWAVLLAFRAWLGDLSSEELEAGTRVPLPAGVVLGLVGAFALMVAGFAALALISRRDRPLRSIALAAALGGLLWLSLTYLVGEPVTPMVAGFAAGGVVALRAEPEHTVGRRVLAAFLITGYVFLLLRFTGFVGVLVGPLLALPAVTWADALSERRALSLPPDREAPGARRRRGR